MGASTAVEGDSVLFAQGRRWRVRWLVLAAAVTLVLVGCSPGGDDGGGDQGAGDQGAGDQGAGDDGGATTTTEPRPTATTRPLTLDSTLETVVQRGALQCGVGIRDGFSVDAGSEFDEESRTGFDVDFCRAIAAAVLGDADAVRYVDTDGDRWQPLLRGHVDVLIRTTTWTTSRDVIFDFGPTIFFDGQQILGVSDKFGLQSTISDLDGSTVCVGADTTSRLNLLDLTRAAGADIEEQLAPGSSEALEEFANDMCDAVTNDTSALVPFRDRREPTLDTWVIFPSTPLSKEPLAPVYRADDSEWGSIVDWVVYSLIIADELDVTSLNVDEMRDAPTSPEMRRLLSEAHLLGSDLGEALGIDAGLGLDPDAFYQAIKQVGNYDEIFERNLDPIGFPRAGSLNAGFLDGGLIYAPPLK
jgi:general L-amino acid transport system substrate-binding protein